MGSSTGPALWSEHDLKVKPYVWSHRINGWLKNAFGLAVLAWLFTSHRGQHLEWFLNSRVHNLYLLWL